MIWKKSAIFMFPQMTQLQRSSCKRSSIASNLWRGKKPSTFVFSLCKALVKLPQPGGRGSPLSLWRLYQTQVCQMREGRNFILKWLRAEHELFQGFLEQMHINWPPSIKITSLIITPNSVRKMPTVTWCSFSKTLVQWWKFPHTKKVFIQRPKKCKD